MRSRRKYGIGATIATHELHLVTNASVTDRARWRRFVVNQSVNCISASTYSPWQRNHFSRPAIYHRAFILDNARNIRVHGSGHTCPSDISLEWNTTETQLPNRARTFLRFCKRWPLGIRLTSLCAVFAAHVRGLLQKRWNCTLYFESRIHYSVIWAEMVDLYYFHCFC